MSDINGSKPTNFPLDESKLSFKIPRDEHPRENLLKLGSMITNRIGLKATADDPEYWGLASVMTDEMVEVALKMGVRKPKTTEQLMKLTKMEREPLEKLLKSAMANAETNHNMDITKLYVAECSVSQGPTLKRIRPRAQGRAYRINKKTSHITLVLKEAE